jgi:hypothetical protein
LGEGCSSANEREGSGADRPCGAGGRKRSPAEYVTPTLEASAKSASDRSTCMLQRCDAALLHVAMLQCCDAAMQLVAARSKLVGCELLVLVLRAAPRRARPRPAGRRASTRAPAPAAVRSHGLSRGPRECGQTRRGIQTHDRKQTHKYKQTSKRNQTHANTNTNTNTPHPARRRRQAHGANKHTRRAPERQTKNQTPQQQPAGSTRHRPCGATAPAVVPRAHGSPRAAGCGSGEPQSRCRCGKGGRP